MKPINIAKQIFGVIFSFKNIDEKITTIIGVKPPMLCASAKLKYLKARTKHADSKIDKKLLNICNLKLLVK
jgi:hypothetical protein